MNKKSKIIITYILVVLMLLVYKFIQPINSFINQMIFYLSSNNTDSISSYLNSYNILAPIISIVLMLLQSVIFPLPNTGLILANSKIFGWWQGAILSYIGIIIGLSLCFYLSNTLFKESINLISNKISISKTNRFFNKNGFYIVLIFRTIPILNFDLLAYLFGVTKIKFSHFLKAITIGTLPLVLTYSYIGKKLVGNSYVVSSILLLIFVLSFIYFKNSFKKKRK